MSDDPQTPAGAPEPSRQSSRPKLAAALPFLITAVAAVLISLLLQSLLLSRRPAAIATPLTSTTSPAPPSPVLPTATPAPTSGAQPTPAPPDRVLRLEILDLREENRQLWSALYLLRAASQIDEAIAALQSNDLDEANRSLLTVYRSLDRAYAFSAEQEKGPIDTFRLQVSEIRDDLRVRPEGLDRRLRQLRRLILSLVDEGG